MIRKLPHFVWEIASGKYSEADLHQRGAVYLTVGEVEGILSQRLCPKGAKQVRHSPREQLSTLNYDDIYSNFPST